MCCRSDLHPSLAWTHDATLDIDDTQANVSDCNTRQRTHDQEACLAFLLHDPLPRDQDYIESEPVHETYLPNPPCEPGSDVPLDKSGSWDPNQTSRHFQNKSQTSQTKGSLSRERWSQLTQFLNLMTPHMDSCNISWVFSCVQKGDKMSERQEDPIAESAESATAKRRPVRNLCANAPHALKFKLPMEHSQHIPSKWRTDWSRKVKKRSSWESAVVFCSAPRDWLLVALEPAEKSSDVDNNTSRRSMTGSEDPTLTRNPRDEAN